MEQDRFAKKRNSLVGGGLAKFEGAEAAEQFVRRQSSYHTRVRQSIPDIRFDENGMPISTRQLQARSHSLAGGSLFPTDRRYSRDGLRRGSDFIPAGGEKNVRKLSKKFSSEEEELKPNFTIPENTRAGKFGSNSRWSVKPEWMKKRRSSTKEEFIEKNLSNLEMLSPTSPKEEEMASISEELTPSSEQQKEVASDYGITEDDTGNMEDNSSSSETGTGSSSDEDQSESDDNCESDEQNNETDIEPKCDIEKDPNTEVDIGDENLDVEGEVGVLKHVEAGAQEKPLKSRKKRRKSKKSKKSTSNGELTARPPPPPLSIQMCDITLFQDELSTSDEDEDTSRTQYGKQKIFVSKCYHVFETTNGPLNEERD